MALPPKPYDALSLLFKCTELGGVDQCAFKLAAGSLVNSRLGTKGPLERATWVYPECVHAFDNQGASLRGLAALQCIAEQRLSIQFPAQIIDIAPRASRECCCQTHRNLRAAAQLAKLIGQHPSSDEE